ncbi:MAG TPA: beta-1,6-N-acetylglucosaminyltransferase [Rhizomicrobium sp.]|nr:beta-1,6-N-acetylglucosaminyltransferase [Rhizomicrobium sp.]
MIFYAIQAHDDVQQLVMLVESIFNESDSYLINLDPNFADQAAAISRSLADKNINNVIVRIGSHLNWGGISQVHATLDVMQYAVSSDIPWRLFINLSGDTLPLVQQSVIHEFYARGLRDGFRAYVSFFGNGAGWKPSNFAMIRLGGERGFACRGKSLRFYGKVPALMEEEARKLCASRETNPIFRTRLRGSLHVSDPMIEKKLIIRRLLPYEAEFRTRALGNRVLYAGRSWYTLERSVIEGLLSDPLTGELVHYLEHFLCPDELFLQTYLMNSNRLAVEKIARDNQWFSRGDSATISDTMEEELFSSGTFYARKVKFTNCPRIYGRVRKMLETGSDIALATEN